MTVGFQDLHPALADILRARMWNMRLSHNARPEDAAARSVVGRRWRGIGWRILGMVPVGAMIGAAIATAARVDPGGVIGISVMGAYFAAIGTGVGSILTTRFGRNTTVTGEELRALSSGLELGKPETIYLDTVCALLEAGNNVSQQTGRDILVTLNELLEQARYVYGRLDRLRKAASSVAVEDLEAERKQLAKRIDHVKDPDARRDLSQSLAICDERLTNARALAPLIERMDAQREVIAQTLLSVQSSVTRLQVAPTALAAPDVEEVKRVVSQVTAQTQAVEDAVQEVMAVRS